MNKNLKIANGTIEIKPLGPNAKQYEDLGSQLKNEFAKKGVMVEVVLCFSEPITTTVLVGIGIGVGAHIVSKVIDRLLDLRAKETGSKTKISVHVEITNKIYLLPKDKNRLLDEYSEE